MLRESSERIPFLRHSACACMHAFCPLLRNVTPVSYLGDVCVCVCVCACACVCVCVNVCVYGRAHCAAAMPLAEGGSATSLRPLGVRIPRKTRQTTECLLSEGSRYWVQMVRITLSIWHPPAAGITRKPLRLRSAQSRRSGRVAARPGSKPKKSMCVWCVCVCVCAHMRV